MLSRRALMGAAGAGGSPPPAPTDWWEAGGATGAVQVLSAIGAASKAASLLDLSGNGNNATETGTIGWDTVNGWGSLSLSNWVDTGIQPTDGNTILISFADGATGNWLAGAFNGTQALALYPGAGGILYWAGNNQATRGANLLTGVIGIADAQPYRTGATDGADLGAWGSAPAVNIGLGKLNGYNFDPWDVGYIRRYVYFDNQLSGAQAKAVSRAMHDFPVFFGDSITVGQGASDAAHRWVTLVAADQDWGTWQNAGISSTVLQNTTQNAVTTIGGAASNNGRDTYTTRVKAYLPNHVLILYGLNDLRLDDVAFSAANYENDLDEIVSDLISDGVPADNIVIGSPPYMNPSYYASYAPYDGGSTPLHEDYRDAAQAVATANGTRFADVYQAMLDNGDDSLIDADGVHPNDSGHQVIADAFIAALA